MSVHHIATEAARQQLLLRVLLGHRDTAALAGWSREAPARLERGVAAYRGNAQALAERALAAAFPTVAQLVGEPSFGALARAFWHHAPPLRGDIGTWGAGLAEFIAGDAQLAPEPYLADSARLDWAVHLCEAAADGDAPPAGVQHLAADDAAHATLRLREGMTLLPSRWPIVAIWHAHLRQGDERFAAVREAFAQGRGECALVWRDGWRVQVDALADAEVRFMRVLADAQTLGAALDAAGADFAFEPWLLRALQHGWLAAVLPAATSTTGTRA